MNRLRIRHITGFHYKGEVRRRTTRRGCCPVSSDGQLVLYSNIEILPISSSHSYVDYWGTRVSSFEMITPHNELSLTATSLVEVRPRAHPSTASRWDDARREIEARPSTSSSSSRPRAPLRRPRSSRSPATSWRRGEARAMPPCRSARRSATGSNTCRASPACTPRRPRRGSRKRGLPGHHPPRARCAAVGGIPARYVSGYLHPKPDAAIGETIAGESHAWVEWFCGDWRGFDPTNLIDIGDRHVTVGRGRDYNDVSPLRGVYAGPYGSQAVRDRRDHPRGADPPRRIGRTSEMCAMKT